MPRTHKFVVRGAWEGMAVYNIFYAETAETDNDSVRLAAKEWLMAFYGAINSHISQDWTCSSADVYEWIALDWTQLGSVNFTGLQGNSGAEPLPRQCAAVLIGQTGVKRAQGRKFIGALTEPAQSAGRLTDTVLAQMIAAALIWTEPYTGTNSVILQPGIWRTTDEFVPFNGYRANRVMGTQRRRKAGVGI